MTSIRTTRRHAIIAIAAVWVLVLAGLTWATRRNSWATPRRLPHQSPGPRSSIRTMPTIRSSIPMTRETHTIGIIVSSCASRSEPVKIFCSSQKIALRRAQKASSCGAVRAPRYGVSD